MSPIEDASDARNVFKLNFPASAAIMTETATRKETRKVKIASKFDSKEAKSAGEVVAMSFGNFLMDAEESELFGFVLDGKTSDERSVAEEEMMGRLLGFLRQTGPNAQSGDTMEHAIFEAATFEDSGNGDSQTVHALSVRSSNSKTTIYLSTQLGFKDLLIAAHFAYSDFATIVAEAFGIELPEGDVANHIREVVSTGKLSLDTPLGEKPKPISITIGDKKVVGIPR